LLEFIETQRPQFKPSMYERALIRYVQANRLFRQGQSAETIAKALKTSVFRVRAYVAFGNLELMQ
jgi:fatty acid-binding protein DegV